MIILLREVFLALDKAIETQFEKDWVQYQGKEISAPSRKHHGQTLPYYGYTDKQSAGLQQFMAKHPKVATYIKGEARIKKFTTKRLHEKVLECEKSSATTITFKKEPYTKIFFLYAGYNGLNHFLNESPFFDTIKGKELRKKQEQLQGEEKDEIDVRQYAIYLYYPDEERITAMKVILDYKNMNRKTVRDNATLIAYNYNHEEKEYDITSEDYISKGTVIVQNNIVTIQFLRDDIPGYHWYPFTMYFNIFKEHPRMVEKVIGMYAGVGKQSKNLLMGEVILVRGGNVAQPPSDVAKHLFLDQTSDSIIYGITKYQKQKGLYSKNDPKGLIETIVGTYEVFWLSVYKRKVNRGKLLINESNYKCTLSTHNANHEYSGKMSLVNNILFITFYAVGKQEGAMIRESRDIDCMVNINLTSEMLNDEITYQGTVNGRNADYFSLLNTEIILLKKDKKDTLVDCRTFSSSELNSFCKQNPTTYPKILSKLLQVKHNVSREANKYPVDLQNAFTSTPKDLLLVIDMQIGFVNEHVAPIIPNIKKLIHSFQEAGQLVAFTKFLNAPKSNFVKYIKWEKMMPSQETDIVDEFEEFGRYNPEVTHQVKVFEKYGYTAYTEEFYWYVNRYNIRRIFICGTDTDSCVLKTAMDTFETNIEPIVIDDACASHSGMEAHKAGIHIIKKNIGTTQVISVQKVQQKIISKETQE